MRESGAGTLDTHEHHAERGFWRTYVFSTDHKMIGKQYLSLGLFWAVVGGLLAHGRRWQLAGPDTAVPGWGEVGPETYNVLVTMHGTIMVFFVAMPILLGAFGNFLIPLMIGARDMAFPRLNMLSVWTLALPSLVLLISFFVPGGAAASGWTAYPPLSAKAIYTGVEWGQNLWIIALALEFASFLMGGINFLTTTINMRAPGLSLFRLPLMIWMQFTAAVLFMLSVGPLIAGAVMLLLDRLAGASLFPPAGGGRPPARVATPLLVLRPPGGLRHHVARDGRLAGDPPRLFPKADLPLSPHRLLDHRRRPPELPRLGPPYVPERHGSPAGDAVQYHHDPHLRPVRHHRLRHDRHPLAGIDPVPDTDAFCPGDPDRLHRGGPDRYLQRLGTRPHLHPRHLLRRGSLPLHTVQRDFLRRFRRDLLLVPKNVRPHDARDPGEDSFLDDLRILQRRLLSHVLPRRRRDDAADREPPAV